MRCKLKYKIKEITRKTIPASFNERIKMLTVTLERLKKRGYKPFLEYYLEVE
ncbi:MAG: hypothetical protein NT175_00320 [Bacteroidetes bacterium]|nr:hypothetical protein [Bacteroidota bacterium]